ncbi:hypothetical protein MRX96_059025 [Rhipicephalus microplus]
MLVVRARRSAKTGFQSRQACNRVDQSRSPRDPSKSQARGLSQNSIRTTEMVVFQAKDGKPTILTKSGKVRKTSFPYTLPSSLQSER